MMEKVTRKPGRGEVFERRRATAPEQPRLTSYLDFFHLLQGDSLSQKVLILVI